ncbi:MAG: Gmad2 immunoglobulin-like domain-containing protein [Minisyncoccales bacterium]
MKKLLIFILVCLIIGGGLFYFLNQPKDKKTPPKETKTIIEGSLGYPSEEIPKEITICAKEINSDKEYCTEKQIENNKYKYGKGYKIEVEPGEYFVVAQKEDGNLKGYYSTYVKCGMEKNCISHFPIAVTAKEGDKLDGIDLLDWTDRSKEFTNEYKNHNFNFKLGYPERIEVREDLRSKEIYFEKENSKPNLTVAIHKNKDNLSLSEWVDQNIQLEEDEFKTPIVFGNSDYRAIFAKTYKSVGVTKQVDRVFYKDNGMIFEINSGLPSIEQNGEERNDLFTGIASSFEKIENEISIDSPEIGAEISSPFTVKGEAKGNWFFEANLGLKLVDEQGNVIDQTYAMTESDWMTEEIIPLQGELNFETDKERGKVIVEKANPSGLSENADKIEIPVFIK